MWDEITYLFPNFNGVTIEVTGIVPYFAHYLSTLRETIVNQLELFRTNLFCASYSTMAVIYQCPTGYVPHHLLTVELKYFIALFLDELFSPYKICWYMISHRYREWRSTARICIISCLGIKAMSPHDISKCISNYIQYKVWCEITYPFLNFNGATVEV